MKIYKEPMSDEEVVFENQTRGRFSRIIQNWWTHKYIIYPFVEIAFWLRLDKLSSWLYWINVPPYSENWYKEG